MNSEDLKQFNALLLQGIAILGQLDHLLEEELAAVGQRDIDKLQHTSQQKQQLIDQFLDCNQARGDLLQRLQVTADEAGTLTLINSAPEAAGRLLQRSWSQLQEALRQIGLKNSRNEQAVIRNKQNVERLLDLVRGQRPQDKVYHASGSAGHYRAQSSLGKA